MPIISRQTIEDIRARVNIHDVVAPYVQLRRVGSSYRGLSPFNPEKTPSFYVHPDRGFFKCFSSGEGGDVFKFIQRVENLNFQEAVERIAESFNIQIEYEKGGAPGPPRSLKNEILAIHEDATAFYADQFWAASELGQEIRNYWVDNRKFDLEIAKSYRIGLAPPDPKTLVNFFRNKPYSMEAFQACGLFYLKETQTSLDYARPRFRGRLMIPIKDIQGRVIAFTARQLSMTPQDDSTRDAKYINSPETPIFHKGDVLFGLEHARKHVEAEGAFLMVEGQLDAIRCFSSGLHTAVAPQGTGITEMQLAKLKRYTDLLYIVLDGDQAGQKAALRALPLTLAAGLDTRFIPLGQGQDPDNLLAEQDGSTLWQRWKSEAISGMCFAVRSLSGGPTRNLSPGKKTAILEQLYGIIAQADSAVIREDYLLEAAHELHVDLSAVKRDYYSFLERKKRFPTPASRLSAEGGMDSAAASSPGPSKGVLTSAEEAILFLLFHYEQYGKLISQYVDPQWINEQTTAGSLLHKTLAEFEHDAWRGTSNLDSLLESDAESNLITDLLIREQPGEDFDPHPHFEAARRRLFDKFFDKQRQQIDEEIANLPPDSEETADRMKQRVELRRLKSKFPPLPKP